MQLFHNEREEAHCEMPELSHRDRSLLGRDGTLTLLDVAHYQYLKRREWQHTLLTWVLLFLVTVLTAGLVILVHAHLQVHRGCERPATSGTDDGRTAGQHQQRVRWRGSPNAHLTGLQNAPDTSGYLEWERERGDAHLQLFAYDEAHRALVVQRGGRYSVYLHVTYRVSEEACRGGGGGGAAAALEQTVFIWSDSYREDMELLRARDFVECGPEPWAKSLYAAGVFSLSAGDRLMVKVYPPALVLRHEKDLFFGAFLVAPEAGGEDEDGEEKEKEREREVCQH